jgi:hypothetical protein
MASPVARVHVRPGLPVDCSPKHRPWAEIAWLWPSVSPDDRDRKRSWAAVLHEPRDLVPVDLVCDCLGYHPGQAKAGQPPHAPGVYGAGFRIDVLA